MSKKNQKNKKRQKTSQYTPLTKKTVIGKFFQTSLPKICYVFVISVWLIVCTFALLSDTIGRWTGNIENISLQAADFEPVEIDLQEDGSFQARTTDPQLWLTDLPTKIRTLRFSAEYSSHPYEICLYYTTESGAPFDKNMRVWPVIQDDGSYLFTLPRTKISAIRIDPASQAIKITLGDIIINEKQSFISYYMPGWGGFTALLTLPALLAAILHWLVSFAEYKFPNIFTKNLKTPKKQKNKKNAETT